MNRKQQYNDVTIKNQIYFLHYCLSSLSAIALLGIVTTLRTNTYCIGKSVTSLHPHSLLHAQIYLEDRRLEWLVVFASAMDIPYYTQHMNCPSITPGKRKHAQSLVFAPLMHNNIIADNYECNWKQSWLNWDAIPLFFQLNPLWPHNYVLIFQRGKR